MAKYHVGSNIPGCLPECDIHCTESIGLAVEYLGAELKDQQEYYQEQCAEYLYDDDDDCECDWCDVAASVQGALHELTITGVRRSIELAGTYQEIFRPEEGPNIVHWITASECDCEEEN